MKIAAKSLAVLLVTLALLASIVLCQPRPIPTAWTSVKLVPGSGPFTVAFAPSIRSSWLLVILPSEDDVSSVKIGEVHTSPLRGIQGIRRLQKIAPIESFAASTTNGRLDLASTGAAQSNTDVLLIARVPLPREVLVVDSEGKLTKLNVNGPATIRDGILLSSPAKSEMESILLASGFSTAGPRATVGLTSTSTQTTEDRFTRTDSSLATDSIMTYSAFPRIANATNRPRTFAFEVSIDHDGKPGTVKCLLGMDDQRVVAEMSNTIRSWRFREHTSKTREQSHRVIKVSVLHLPDGSAISEYSPGVTK